jgi:hypothetical protein
MENKDMGDTPVFCINVAHTTVELSGVWHSTFWDTWVAAENAIYAKNEERARVFFEQAWLDPTIILAEGIFMHGHCIIGLFVKLRYFSFLPERQFFVLSALHSYSRP